MFGFSRRRAPGRHAVVTSPSVVVPEESVAGAGWLAPPPLRSPFETEIEALLPTEASLPVTPQGTELLGDLAPALPLLLPTWVTGVAPAQNRVVVPRPVDSAPASDPTGPPSESAVRATAVALVFADGDVVALAPDDPRVRPFQAALEVLVAR